MHWLIYSCICSDNRTFYGYYLESNINYTLINIMAVTLYFTYIYVCFLGITLSIRRKHLEFMYIILSILLQRNCIYNDYGIYRPHIFIVEYKVYSI